MGSHWSGIPWDSHGNGNKISHGNGNGMGMGTKCMGMEIMTWEWGKYSHENTVLNCSWQQCCGSLVFYPHEMGRERNDLAQYMNLKVSKDTDLIQFWLDNKSVLLNLYTVARQVQCVPTSSAASERVFSTAGRMLENSRTNFSPAAVNSLLFLHSNME